MNPAVVMAILDPPCVQNAPLHHMVVWPGAKRRGLSPSVPPAGLAWLAAFGRLTVRTQASRASTRLLWFEFEVKLILLGLLLRLIRVSRPANVNISKERRLLTIVHKGFPASGRKRRRPKYMAPPSDA